MSRAFSRISEGLFEAVALARGETDPARLHHFGPHSADEKKAAPHGGGLKGEAMQTILNQKGFTKSEFGLSAPNVVTDPAEMAPVRQSKAEQSAGYSYAGRTELTLKQWSDVPDNPRQRDTEAHARKAKHLRQYDPIHRFVQMAVLPNGDRFKLDGHTRSLMWDRGMVGGPPTVIVDVFSCDSLQIAQELYSKIDSQAAVETGADKIKGAARQHGLVFKYAMFRDGRYGSAVKRLYMYTSKNWHGWTEAQFIYDAVGFYKNELVFIDDLGPRAQIFPSGVVMAAIATLRRRGSEAFPFWRKYAACEGTKIDGRMDAVQALHEAVMNAKARKDNVGGMGQQLALLSKGVAAVESYRRGYEYTVGHGLRSLNEDNLRAYLRHSREG